MTAAPTTTLAAHKARGPLNVRRGYLSSNEHWECWGCDWEGDDEQAHAAHQLAVLADAGFLVIPTPTVDYMRLDDTITTAYRGAVWRLRGGFEPGGSNMRASIARTLESIASAVEKGTAR